MFQGIKKCSILFYFYYLHCLSKLNLIPFETQFKTRDQIFMKVGTPKRNLVWKIAFAYGVVRTCYSCYHLVALTLRNEDPASSYEMILHTVYTTSSSAFVLLEVGSFIKAPDIVAGIFNLLYTMEEGKNISHLSGDKRRVKVAAKPFSKHSLQELVAIFLPALTIQFNLTTHILISIFCTKIHIFQFLGESYQNPITFCLLFIQEFIIFQGHLGTFILTSVNFLLFFENVNSSLHLEIGLLRSIVSPRMINLEQKFKMCRKTELLINLFNLGYSSGIYLFKMFFMFLAIGCTYFGIRCASTHLLLSMFLNSIGVYGILIYAVIFGKAFLISQFMHTIKIELSRVGKICIPGKVDFKYFQRRVASIHSVGIQVGGFHTMERESTPVFVDFAVRCVASLLLTSD